MVLDQRVQAEALVQLAWEQQPSIGSDRGSLELDAELRIEREANRQMSRHPLGGALRASEEPPRAAFRTGVDRLWPTAFSVQIKHVGEERESTVRTDERPSAVRLPLISPCFGRAQHGYRVNREARSSASGRLGTRLKWSISAG